MGTPQVPSVPPATPATPQALPVPPKYRKPSAGPTADNVQDQTLWQQLSEQSLASTQVAAEKWRTGLAAFVTLATGGLLLKGPSAASDVTTGWRIALTILALGGLLAAIVGLWLALRAAAGTPAKLNLTEVVAMYGGVRQFEVATALAASAQLRLARRVVAGSLPALRRRNRDLVVGPPKASPAASSDKHHHAQRSRLRNPHQCR